jgi:hypothetical protein
MIGDPDDARLTSRRIHVFAATTPSTSVEVRCATRVGTTSSKAEAAALGAALALHAAGHLDRRHTEILARPMAEALPWLASIPVGEDALNSSVTFAREPALGYRADTQQEKG